MFHLFPLPAFLQSLWHLLGCRKAICAFGRLTFTHASPVNAGPRGDVVSQRCVQCLPWARDGDLLIMDATCDLERNK